MPEYSYTVLPEYIGGFGHVTASSIVRIFQRAATQHSDDLGYTSSWYQDQGVAWMARKHRMRQMNPLPTDQPLTVRTHVEDFQRVRSLRFYEFVEPSGETLVRGYTDWIYVDRTTGRPRRIPPKLTEAFEPQNEETSDERSDLPSPETIDREPNCILSVHFGDLDELGHVNNAVYVDYLHEGICAKFQDEIPLPRNSNENKPMTISQLSIRYMGQSRWRDTISCRLRSDSDNVSGRTLEFTLRSDKERVAEGTVSLNI